MKLEWSERESAAELPEPRLVRSSCGTKASIREIGVNICVVGTVEEVKELETHLEVESFGHMNVFVDVGIGLKEVWPAELHGLFIALATERRNRKVALGDGASKPGLIARR